MKIAALRYFIIGFLMVFIGMVNFGYAADTHTTKMVVVYRNELTFMICLVVLMMASWLGATLPTEEGEKDLPKRIKFVTGLLGGVLAFVYCLHKDKELTLLNPIWVAGACIVLPVTILNIRSKLKAYTKSIDSKLGE